MTVIFFRTIILYFLIMITLRIMGKRQIGELEPNELAVTIMISELASLPMQDTSISLISGIMPIIILLCLELITSFVVLKSITLRKFLQGKPSILIENGKIVQKELAKCRISVDELMEELRLQGYTDISKVKYAIQETSGRFSVLPFAAEKPPTAAEMNIKTTENGLPMTIISDGTILDENLKLRLKTEKKLEEILRKKGKIKVSQVFLLMVDEQDNVYLSLKEQNK